MESQHDLYRIMAELAFVDEIRPDSYHFGADRVDWLESTTDAIGDAIRASTSFHSARRHDSRGRRWTWRERWCGGPNAPLSRSRRSAGCSNQEILRYLNRFPRCSSSARDMKITWLESNRPGRDRTTIDSARAGPGFPPYAVE